MVKIPYTGEDSINARVISLVVLTYVSQYASSLLHNMLTCFVPHMKSGTNIVAWLARFLSIWLPDLEFGILLHYRLSGKEQLAAPREPECHGKARFEMLE